MSGIATAVVGSAIIGGVVASKSASKAADAQQASSEAGIAEQRYEFDKAQELLKPYVDAGNSAVTAQGDLLGLNGPDAQKKAVAGVESSPEFDAITRQGETSILQNASATGGLRGGNVQAALAQFRPQLLAQLIQSRFGQLGSVVGTGQASAAGTAAAAQNTGNNITSLLGQIGAAQAGSALATGQAVNNVTNSIGTLALLKGMKVF